MPYPRVKKIEGDVLHCRTSLFLAFRSYYTSSESALKEYLWLLALFVAFAKKSKRTKDSLQDRLLNSLLMEIKYCNCQLTLCKPLFGGR